MVFNLTSKMKTICSKNRGQPVVIGYSMHLGAWGLLMENLFASLFALLCRLCHCCLFPETVCILFVSIGFKLDGIFLWANISLSLYMNKNFNWDKWTHSFAKFHIQIHTSVLCIWLQSAIDSKSRLVNSEELSVEGQLATNCSQLHTSTALGPVGALSDLYEVLRPSS
mmetsp:Transcript_4534/g.6916  ORF Transcript_4534/g.6916 Transcript_4534/m.6916 type:complete len:168 (+) Transcript_4534:838-1341(+)